MTELFLSAFVTLFVIIDPMGCAPIFASLTGGGPAAWRRQMAVRSALVAGGILFVFALFGRALLETLGISLGAFRIAGGLMLFLIALEMVFERRTQRREKRADDIQREAAATQAPPDDISVFPMALPMIAGPGSIATVMLMVQRAHDATAIATVLAALAAVLALTLLALLAAGPIMRLLGPKIEAAITRLLGVLLGALGAQFVVDGLKASFGI
ncbi:MAG: MarC family protein [Sphingomonas fennica]